MTRAPETVWQELKRHYPGVKDVVVEDENILCVYADDDTLWKMYDELPPYFQTVEFNARDQDQNYIRIVLGRRGTSF